MQCAICLLGPDSSNSATADTKATAGQPLGPPPRPSQPNPNDADYFSQNHNQNANNGYQAEPNPFEQQFGNPSADTPGKLLPSVAQLTSPQSLLPNSPSEMRLGPLSPAMLAGPASGDYFDSGYSRSFPTPNESSLRTGLTPGGGSMLTPGGGGSMFPPAPSPNTQALFNSFALSGVNTPSMGDFMRSAVATKAAGRGNTSGPTSRPMVVQTTEAMDLKASEGQSNAPNGVFAHPESDAANGLFMLAQANGGRPGHQFGVPAAQSTAQASSSLAGIGQPSQAQGRRNKDSIGSSDSQGDDQSDSDRSEEVAKPATRSRGKKPATEAKTPANSRRKAADTAAKGYSAKRRKVSVSQDPDMDMDDDEDMEDNLKDNKKMTDEEKRKNFLERNR
jgi:ATF/CREB family transcription factor